MKRGLLIVIAVLLLASSILAQETDTCVQSLNPDNFIKVAGDNWTYQGHNLTLPLRENPKEETALLRFDDKIKEMDVGSCYPFGIYNVCLTNSTLQPIINPNYNDNTYEYTFDIYQRAWAISQQLSFNTDSGMVGDTVKATMKLQNTGCLEIPYLEWYFDTAPFKIMSSSKGCTFDGSKIIYKGGMTKQKQVVCDVDLRITTRNITYFNVSAKVFDKKMIFVSLEQGPSASIDSSLDMTSITLPSDLKIGKWYVGNLTIKNNFDSSLTFDNILSMPNAELSIRKIDSKTIFAGSYQVIEFDFMPKKTGDLNLNSKTSISMFSQSSDLFDSKITNVLLPEVQIQAYGRLSVPQVSKTHLSIEAYNREEYDIKNVTLKIEFPDNIISPQYSFMKDIKQSKTADLYYDDILVNFSSGFVTVPYRVSYITPYGEKIMINKSFIVTSGSSDPLAVQNPQIPPYVETPSSNNSASDSELLTISIAIIIICIIAGIVLWFLSNSFKSKQEE